MAHAVDVVDAVFRRTGRTVKVQGREFKIGIFRDFSVFRPKKLFGGLAPIWVRRWKLHPPYRLVKVS